MSDRYDRDLPCECLDCDACRGPLSEYDLEAADLGDVVVVLLVGTLAGLRDRLYRDGFEPAASLIQDLIEVADDYVSRRPP